MAIRVIKKCEKVVYRWRCPNCQSLLEEDDEAEYLDSIDEEEWGEFSDWFFCPVCNKRRPRETGTTHCYNLMSDGTEEKIW